MGGLQISNRIGNGRSGSGSTPLTFESIFGANYYDDWDFNDLATISQTGGLINSITSKGLNGAVSSSTGANRPLLTADVILGKNIADFDGVSDYLEVPLSTAMYNFLHNGQGLVICVLKFKTPITATKSFMANVVGTVSIGFFMMGISSNKLSHQIVRGVGGTRTVRNDRSIVGTESDYNSIVVVSNTSAGTATERSNLLINGVSNKNNTDTNAPSGSNASLNLVMGAAGNTASLPANVKIARIVIIDTLPTTEQLTQVQTLLTSEYGTFPIS
jgi:hypothetical protein